MPDAGLTPQAAAHHGHAGDHHQHGPGHLHGHAGTARWRLGVAFGITAAILVAEVVGATLTGSLALLADAGHMLTDVVGLGIALVASGLMARPATLRRTWGFLRAEVLAAAMQASILLLVGLFALVEGTRRLITPADIEPHGLLLFGLLGLVGNVVALGVLAGGRNANLNLRAAFLEVVNDALGSVAVIVGALVIQWTGWVQADAVAGILIAVLIVPRALAILRRAGSVLLETTPDGLDVAEVRRHILALPHVLQVHDLHASEIATGVPILTAHVVLDDSCFHDGHTAELLGRLRECVAAHFPVSIEHATFQLEPASKRCGWTHQGVPGGRLAEGPSARQARRGRVD